MAQSLEVNHNVEMAHRLTCLGESKCMHIHGHSWRVHLEVIDLYNEAEGPGNVIMDLSNLKRTFRSYLDNGYDHRLALDKDDPLVTRLSSERQLEEFYPGYVLTPGPPTVENMAKWWGEHMRKAVGLQFGYRIKVYEAATNAATWEG
jgi:6-pyruvoyl-tetrahydropterin synthase